MAYLSTKKHHLSDVFLYWPIIPIGKVRKERKGGLATVLAVVHTAAGRMERWDDIDTLEINGLAMRLGNVSLDHCGGITHTADRLRRALHVAHDESPQVIRIILVVTHREIVRAGTWPKRRMWEGVCCEQRNLTDSIKKRLADSLAFEVEKLKAPPGKVIRS